METVVLVDKNDREIGKMEKLEAHEKGVLHRAISVCLFDDQGRWLIQKRAMNKYHSPGLYANSCCSHPRPGEAVLDAAVRRVGDELRIKNCPLTFCSTFVYREEVGSGLVEYEYDYLFKGLYSEKVLPNPEEVAEVVFWTQEEIEIKLRENPSIFAAWFPRIYKEMQLYI